MCLPSPTFLTQYYRLFYVAALPFFIVTTSSIIYVTSYFVRDYLNYFHLMQQQNSLVPDCSSIHIFVHMCLGYVARSGIQGQTFTFSFDHCYYLPLPTMRKCLFLHNLTSAMRIIKQVDLCHVLHLHFFWMFKLHCYFY